EEQPEAPETRPDPTKAVEGKETVLLVEDEEIVRELAASILKTSGFAVLEAEDGAEALARSEQYRGPIHIMVTDVVMPQMSGRGRAARFRRGGTPGLQASSSHRNGNRSNSCSSRRGRASGTAPLQRRPRARSRRGLQGPRSFAPL